MNHIMKKLCTIIVGLSICGFSNASYTMSEELLRKISNEGVVAVETSDITFAEKYIHPSSVLVIDMDPAPNTGETQIPYKEYLAMTKMALENLQDAKVSVQILSIEIDKEKNQGTLEEKTTATMEMMGTKMKDTSVTVSTYGFINGKVKVLKAVNTIISSEILE